MKKEEKVIYYTIADGTGLEDKDDFIVFGFLDGEQYAQRFDKKQIKRVGIKFALKFIGNTFYFLEENGKQSFDKFMMGSKSEIFRICKKIKARKEKGIITVYARRYRKKKVPYSFYKKYVK